MAYQDKNIVGVTCKSEDGSKVYYENKTSIKKYSIPSNCDKIVYHKRRAEEIHIRADIAINYEEIKKEANLTPEESKQCEILENEDIEFLVMKNNPVMTYSDVTEKVMFGFPDIQKNVLVSPENGLWAYHGLRKLKFHFENLPQYNDDFELSANLVFDHLENDEMIAIQSGDNDVIRNKDSSEENNGTYELFVFVDTNKFGEKFSGRYENKQNMLFSGYIQVKFSYDKKETTENNVVYIFPVELLINNTNYNYCRKIEKNTVSIDFGTSSSCVAVRGKEGIELITLSAAEETAKDINIYENPTSVMIYRWKEIYAQWKKENEDFPIMLKGNLEDHKLNKKSVQFDFGYSVKENLKEVNDEELNAILTEIKMIPKNLNEGTQMKVRPLVAQDKKVINLVDSYDKQDDENFDVIAFYGYILGKAINRVEKNKIYTKFQITYPVKFSTEVRDKVKKSLEYGLRRSLPKPLRDAENEKGQPVFSVDMKYPEPVAYVGSVCGRYLKVDEKPEMFAVFDFGGGTLDYSFGVFAPNEDEPGEYDIHVLGVDGDSNVGGELLIKRMSYWLYTATENIEAFVEKKIPFERPTGEVLPDTCPEDLFDSSATAKSNVRKISERFIRDIFQEVAESAQQESETVAKNESEASENTGGVLIPKKSVGNTTKNAKTPVVTSIEGNGNNTSSASITLRDKDDTEQEIKVTVDKEVLNKKLEELLEQKVKEFKDIMDRTFTAHEEALKKMGISEYDSEKVHIFEAGNSSKNIILKKKMKENLKKNNIQLVDETDNELMNNETKEKKIALTPKTAVALGQVRLGDYLVVDSYIRQGTGDAPFNWYIFGINHGNDTVRMVIDKANVQKEWVKYGRINSTDMKVYYAETPVDSASDLKLHEVGVDLLEEEHIGKRLFVRVNDSDSLECCVCDSNLEPGETENMEIIKLK